MPSLADEIATRASLPKDLAELNAALVERYDVKVSLDNFSYKLFALTDLAGRSVSVVHSQVREGKVHTSKPRTDVVVFATGDPAIIIGWTSKDNLRDVEDRFLVSTKSLFPMPTVFEFSQPCAHMEIHGGYFNDNEQAWECFGCGIAIARTSRG